jgi:hypothetical protein
MNTEARGANYYALEHGRLTGERGATYARYANTYMAEPGAGESMSSQSSQRVQGQGSRESIESMPGNVRDATEHLEAVARGQREARQRELDQLINKPDVNNEVQGHASDLRDENVSSASGQPGSPDQPTGRADATDDGSIIPPTETGGIEGDGREPPSGGAPTGDPSPEPGDGRPPGGYMLLNEAEVSRIREVELLRQANAVENLIDALAPSQVYEKLVDKLGEIALFEDVDLDQKQVLIQAVQRAISEIIKRNEDASGERRQEGFYGERKLLKSEKDEIRNAEKPEALEELFNRMFDRVDARPQVDFQSGFGGAGGQEYEEFMRILNEEVSEQNKQGNFTRSKELSDIRDKFSNERTAREIIHNAFFAVISGQNTEAVSKYISNFLAGYQDLAFSKAGVVAAMHFYEQSLLVVREKNGGYLVPKDVTGHIKDNTRGEVNDLAEKMLMQANEDDGLTLVVDNEGRPRKLARWEIDRALSFARGMSIIVGNSIEIAATSIVPAGEQGASAINNLFAQGIIGEVFPFRHLLKYWTGSKFSKPLAYLLKGGKSSWAWTPEELQVFEDMGMKDQIKILNDLAPEGEERFLSMLNPFEIGGMLSKTGWRVAGDPNNPGETAIREMLMNPKERDWIGTGIIIERNRGHLSKLDDKDPEKRAEGVKAREEIRSALERTVDVTPLKVFLNIREVKERVLIDLFEGDYFPAVEKDIIQAFVDGQQQSRELWTDEVEIRRALDNRPELDHLSSQEKMKRVDKIKNENDETLKKLKLEAVLDSDTFKKDFSDLVVLQERALMTKDEEIVGENSRLGREIADTFLALGTGERSSNTFITYEDAFIQRLKDKGWKVPFVFGTEDIPFDKYTFEDTGPDSVARRWRDLNAAAKAGHGFTELIIGIEHFKNQEQIVEAINKIYMSIFEYSEESAQKFTEQIAEGVMKFYAKSWKHRLPFGIGSTASLATGEGSFAQILYGRTAMAWDETDLSNFTTLLRGKGSISVEGQQRLQERAGGGKGQVMWAVSRSIIPFLLALGFYAAYESTKKVATRS